MKISRSLNKNIYSQLSKATFMTSVGTIASLGYTISTQQSPKLPSKGMSIYQSLFSIKPAILAPFLWCLEWDSNVFLLWIYKASDASASVLYFNVPGGLTECWPGTQLESSIAIALIQMAVGLECRGRRRQSELTTPIRSSPNQD